MPQLRQYAEKYNKNGLVVVAINLQDSPQGVVQFLRDKQVDPRVVLVLLGGVNVQRAFGVNGPHHSFLIDQRSVIRAHHHGALDDRKFDQKIEMVLGMLPPEFGWRRAVAVTYQRAIEDANAGRFDQALEALKSIAPPRVMVVEVETSALPAPYVKPCLQAAQAAVQQWQTILSKLTRFQLVSSEEKRGATPADDQNGSEEKTKPESPPEDQRPHVVLKFLSQVFDPNDNTGLTTVCAHMRVMNEGARGERKPQHTLAMIAVGHASSGIIHRPEAMVHLVQSAIAYALGLDNRDEADSITSLSVDDGVPVLRPSPEDLAALSNLLSSVHLQMGSVYLQQKKFPEAAEAFSVVLAISPNDPRAAEGLKQARQQQGAAGGQ